HPESGSTDLRNRHPSDRPAQFHCSAAAGNTADSTLLLFLTPCPRPTAAYSREPSCLLSESPLHTQYSAKPHRQSKRVQCVFRSLRSSCQVSSGYARRKRHMTTFSSKRLPFVIQASDFKIGFTRTLRTPLRCAERTSVMSWSPTMMASSR